MEVGFNVSHLGPISQLSIPLLDVPGAVQLARGVHGWWKARPRSITFTQAIEAAGGQLSPSTTFVKHRYYEARDGTEVRGIAWDDGKLESLALPNASTSTEGDDGLICLRAIISALLAIYNVETASAILTHIIPRCLINYDLEDDLLIMDGAIHTSLREFIVAVSVEEQANTLRKSLWDEVDKRFSRLSFLSAHKFRIDDIQEIEVPIVIGLLQWALANPVTLNYPTRSTTAWAFTIMLSYLGFEVMSSSTVLTSTELYDRWVYQETLGKQVYLVTASPRPTDPLAPQFGLGELRGRTLAPRVVPIRAVPALLFRPVQYLDINTTVEQLCKIWDETFEHVTSTLQPVRITPEQGFVSLLPPQPPDLEDRIVQTFEPLLWLIEPQLKTFIPAREWLPEGFSELLRGWMFDKAESNFSDPESSEWWIFSAIIFGAIYATASKSLNVTSHQQDGSGRIGVEVAVRTDILPMSSSSTDIYRWISTIVRAMKYPSGVLLRSRPRPDGAEIHEWLALHYELFTGASVYKLMQGNPDAKRNNLGFQRNGITVIRDVALCPSLVPESLVKFHVQSGQPIEIPVDDDGFIIGQTQGSYIATRGESQFDATGLKQGELGGQGGSDCNVRIDLEPCWATDPRKVIFRVRVDGVPKCSLFPNRLISRIQKPFRVVDEADAEDDDEDAERIRARTSEIYRVTCKCKSERTGLGAQKQGNWRVLKLSELVKQLPFSADGDTTRFVTIAGVEEIIIAAKGDHAAQVLAVTCFTGPALYVSTCSDCLLRLISNERNSENGSEDMGEADVGVKEEAMSEIEEDTDVEGGTVWMLV